MNIDFIQIGVFLLAFVPGFIFIQVVDHHLLKGEKTQFEKTIQILLASTIIWLIAFITPYLFPIQKEKDEIILLIKNNIQNNKQISDIINEILKNINKFIKIYIFICLYSFITANLWGIIRRNKYVDKFIRSITKRDWYKTVSLRFYDENIDSTILITRKDKLRYLGILNGAPDDKNDNYIMITDPYIVENNFLFTKLAASTIIIKIDEIELIEVIKKYKGGKNVSKKQRVK